MAFQMAGPRPVLSGLLKLADGTVENLSNMVLRISCEIPFPWSLTDTFTNAGFSSILIVQFFFLTKV